MRNAIHLLCVLTATALGAGCGGGSDPCSSQSGGTCITLQVSSNLITQLQQLSVTSQVAGQAAETRISPLVGGGLFSLPFEMALVYPTGQAGQVQVSGTAELSSAATADGQAVFELVSGVDQMVELLLDQVP